MTYTFRHIPQILTLLGVFLIHSAVFGYNISGQLKNIKWKKGIKIGLAAINGIDQFRGMNPEQYINAVDIDKDGNFRLEGTNLPLQERFYRIYMREENYFVLVQIPDQQNFIDLVLDNNSVVAITVDLATSPLYLADVTGVLHAKQYLDFYRDIYYRLPSPSASTSEQAFNKEKVNHLIKTTIAKNNNPYYTILVLSTIDLRHYYRENPNYYGDVIDHLDHAGQDNIYVKELQDRKRVYDFEISPLKRYLNVRFFILLLTIILVLSIMLVYRFIKTRQDRRASRSHVGDALASLTKKEKEIIELMRAGKTNKEIAATLFIEISTVKTHTNSIFQKFKVSNRNELLAFIGNQQLQPGVEP